VIRLSCSTLSADGFRDNDFALSLEAIPAAGYRYVELNCWHPSNLVPAKIEDLSRRCAEAGLVPSAVYGCAFGGNATKDVNDKLWLMEAARRLGCERVVMTGPERVRDDGIRHIVTVLSELAPAAEAMGVSLCLENHAGNALEGLDDYERIFDRIDSSRVGACLDTGHFDAVGGDMTRFIDVLGRKVNHVHVKDNLGRSGVRFVRFGEGTTDHHGAIRRLLEIGYSGYLDVELSPTSEGLTDGVPDVENLVLARKMFEVYAGE